MGPQRSALFAKAGKLFRLAGPPWDESHAREIADFTAERFEEMAAAPVALKWPPKRGRKAKWCG